jgi:hypothetical protein
MTGFGPAGSFTVNNNQNSITNPFTETPSFLTIAAICEQLGSGGEVLFATTPASPNYVFTGSSTWRFSGGGTITLSGLPATVGHTYFIACSATPTVKYFVAADLTTGALYKSTITSGSSLSTTGTWNLGALNGLSNFDGYIHAVMYSVALLSPQQLLAWAQAPWDFWYPQSAENLMFGAFAAPPADSFALAGQSLVFM